MKKVLELAGVILSCVLVPYLVASLLEWGFIVENWSNPTKVILGMIYSVLIPLCTFAYLIETNNK